MAELEQFRKLPHQRFVVELFSASQPCRVGCSGISQPHSCGKDDQDRGKTEADAWTMLIQA